jgi:hypothetical protein
VIKNAAMKLTGAQLGRRLINILPIGNYRSAGSQSKTLFDSLCMSNVVFYGVLGEMFSFQGPSGR